MPGPEECFESKQALNARFRESNRNISPIEKDYHTNLKECKNDILFIAYLEIINAADIPSCIIADSQTIYQRFMIRILISYLL